MFDFSFFFFSFLSQLHGSETKLTGQVWGPEKAVEWIDCFIRCFVKQNKKNTVQNLLECNLFSVIIYC